MTLINVGTDTELLLTLLRQRLRSVIAQITAMEADQSTASDIRQLLNAGWIEAQKVEAAFLTDLISRIEQGELRNGA